MENSSDNTFFYSYMRELVTDIPHWYKDDFYVSTYNVKTQPRYRSWLEAIIKSFLSKLGYIHKDTWTKNLYSGINTISPHLPRIESLYKNLADDESRKLLVKLMAYRALGYRKVKLPLNSSDFLENVEKAKKIQNKSDIIKNPYPDGELARFNLNSIGFPAEIYCTTGNVYTQFIYEQYKYKSENHTITIKQDDYIIDAGACYGDASIFFAHLAGENGKVYSFEFLPFNLKVFKKNLSINPVLRKRITIIEKALWNSSNKKLNYIEGGSGTRISADISQKRNKPISTITIDDFVKEANLPHLDFIKMDIEGSEIKALQGAIKTIKKYKPKLAISIYHKKNDFLDIPEFIQSLGIGYKLYIGHYTIHAEETILYAEIEKYD